MANKITLTTIKGFIKREAAAGRLHLKKLSDFDGMIDCVRDTKDNFTKVDWKGFATDVYGQTKNDLGIPGAWFVLQSRDYFTPFADDNFIGYEVYNCCGSFILAFPRQ